MTLTQEQLAVAADGINTRQLVVAGPGTGKTHTLVARLVHLVDECGLAPGQEILVLSFTRNAVREIRRRVRVSGGDAAYVTAMTFDSFATRMLSALEPGGSWASESYDGRIRYFGSCLLRPSGEAMEQLDELRHILVDEVQDLVGDRAQMVQALLGAVKCGFTLMGDPAQAIYDYQQNPELPRKPPFTEWAKQSFPGLTARSLTKNHRIRGKAAAVALWAGPALAEQKSDEALDSAIRETFRNLPALPGLRPIATAAQRSSSAVLCRSNGQALVFSEMLYRESIDHVLQGEATSAPVEGWLSRCLIDLDAPIMTRSDLTAVLAERAAGLRVDEDEVWRALRAIGRVGKAVDLSLVAARLAQRWMPDELVQGRASNLVVSSIHRAKGLEFDTVVVVADADDRADSSQHSEESRVLYVAMTRAASFLFRFDLGPQWGLRLGSSDRWVVAGTGRQQWRRMAVQLGPGDVDRETPPTDSVHSAQATQDLLWSNVRRGHEVVLEVDRSSVSGGRPQFTILHGGRCIGRTSEAFGRILRKELRGEVENWPSRITGVRVSTVESVAGTRAQAERAGFDGHGFWLAVRLEGLGRYDWSERCGGPFGPTVAAASHTPGRVSVLPAKVTAGVGAGRPPSHATAIPNTATARRKLWTRLQALAEAGDLEGIKRELPEAWSHNLEDLLRRASRVQAQGRGV